MNKTLQICTIAVLLFQCGESWTQIQQPNRFEINMNEGEDYFTTLSAGKNGMVMFRETKELDREKGGYAWEIIKLDTLLNLGHITKLYSRFAYLYSLLLFPLDRKIGGHLYQRKAKEYEIKRIVPVGLTDFTVMNELAIFVGRVNYRPAIVIHDFRTQFTRVLPGIYGNFNEIVEVSPDRFSNTINVIQNNGVLGVCHITA